MVSDDEFLWWLARERDSERRAWRDATRGGETSFTYDPLPGEESPEPLPEMEDLPDDD